jgi:hypothetical protein
MERYRNVPRIAENGDRPATPDSARPFIWSIITYQ